MAGSDGEVEQISQPLIDLGRAMQTALVAKRVIENPAIIGFDPVEPRGAENRLDDSERVIQFLDGPRRLVAPFGARPQFAVYKPVEGAVGRSWISTAAGATIADAVPLPVKSLSLLDRRIEVFAEWLREDAGGTHRRGGLEIVDPLGFLTRCLTRNRPTTEIPQTLVQTVIIGGFRKIATHVKPAVDGSLVVPPEQGIGFGKAGAAKFGELPVEVGLAHAEIIGNLIGS